VQSEGDLSRIFEIKGSRTRGKERGAGKQSSALSCRNAGIRTGRQGLAAQGNLGALASRHWRIGHLVKLSQSLRKMGHVLNVSTLFIEIVDHCGSQFVIGADEITRKSESWISRNLKAFHQTSHRNWYSVLF
jgi:hypothetical protein